MAALVSAMFAVVYLSCLRWVNHPETVHWLIKLDWPGSCFAVSVLNSIDTWCCLFLTASSLCKVAMVGFVCGWFCLDHTSAWLHIFLYTSGQPPVCYEVRWSIQCKAYQSCLAFWIFSRSLHFLPSVSAFHMSNKGVQQQACHMLVSATYCECVQVGLHVPLCVKTSQVSKIWPSSETSVWNLVVSSDLPCEITETFVRNVACWILKRLFVQLLHNNVHTSI